MTKRSVTLLLVLVMMLNLMTTCVFAEELPEVEAGVYITAESEEKTLNKDVSHTFSAVRVENADVTITGGNIKGLPSEGGYAMAVWSRNEGANVTITGGTFTNEPDPNDPTHVDLIYASKGATVVVEGGTFKCATPKWTLNCLDDSGSKITVKGGKFYQYNPAVAGVKDGPNYVGENEVVVAEGYKVIGPVDGYYEVVPANKVEAGVYITAESEEKTLNKDVTYSYVAVRAEGTDLTINGGNIRGLCSVNGGYAMAVWAKGEGTNITIKGGTFTNEPDPASPKQSDLIDATGGATIVIEGGTFKCATPQWTLNCGDRSGSTITVKGGRFYQFDPSKANVPGTGVAPEGWTEIIVPDDYMVEGPDAEGYYSVVCAHDKSNLEKQVEKPATYVEEGNEAYYVCKGNNCGKWFKDAEGKEEITDKSSIIIPKLIEVNDKKDEVVVKNEAVDNAVADATANNTDVVIPLGNIGTTVSSVALPVEKLEVVAGTDKALVVETTEAVVTIDNKALEEVVKQAGAEPTITLEVKKVEEKVLSETQQAVIENKEVAFVFTAEMLANGKEISNFNGGKVKLAIPFTPAENTNASDYKVFYIADDGSISEVLTQYVDGKIVVELEHFSEYALINVNKVANQGGTGSAAPAPATKDNTPKTGATSVVVAMMAIAGAGYMLTRKEER